MKTDNKYQYWDEILFHNYKVTITKMLQLAIMNVPETILKKSPNK